MKIKRQINLKPLKNPQLLKKSPKKNQHNKQINKERNQSRRMAPNKSKISSNLQKRLTVNKKRRIRSRVTPLLAS